MKKQITVYLVEEKFSSHKNKPNSFFENYVLENQQNYLELLNAKTRIDNIINIIDEIIKLKKSDSDQYEKN